MKPTKEQKTKLKQEKKFYKWKNSIHASILESMFGLQDKELIFDYTATAVDQNTLEVVVLVTNQRTGYVERKVKTYNISLVSEEILETQFKKELCTNSIHDLY